MGDLRETITPNHPEVPGPREGDDSDLSRERALDLAVEWMKENPADSFTHPDLDYAEADSRAWEWRWCLGCLSRRNLERDEDDKRCWTDGSHCSECGTDLLTQTRAALSLADPDRVPITPGAEE
jgi:hypothetical protein